MANAYSLAKDVRKTLEWVTRMRWEQDITTGGESLIYLDSVTPTPVRVFCQVSSGGRPDVGIGLKGDGSFKSLNANSPGGVRENLALAVWRLLLDTGYNEFRPLGDILQEWLVDYWRGHAVGKGLTWEPGPDRGSLILGGDLVVDHWWRGFPDSGYPCAELHFTQENESSGNYRRRVTLDASQCPYKTIMECAQFAVLGPGDPQ